MTAPIWEFNARRSGTHEMAERVNVDRAFNVGDIKSVCAIRAYHSSCVAVLWSATFGFGMFEESNNLIESPRKRVYLRSFLRTK